MSGSSPTPSTIRAAGRPQRCYPGSRDNASMPDLNATWREPTVRCGGCSDGSEHNGEGVGEGRNGAYDLAGE
jgi:hypothetical protein